MCVYSVVINTIKAIIHAGVPMSPLTETKWICFLIAEMNSLHYGF